jgi:uncharacterized repeat protein (TIGR03803 family)
MSKRSAILAKALIAVLVLVAGASGVEAKDGYSDLYLFQGGQDGNSATPGLIIGKEGNLYGMTAQGGGSGCSGGGGCGTIYQVSPRGDETVLYRFTGIPDGFYPQAGLVADQTGNLYGTTEYGGLGGCQFNTGCGTLFKLAPDRTEQVLYAFQNEGNPDAALARDKRGNLFGIISSGYGGSGCGGVGCGAAFELSHNAKYKVLHRFVGENDAATPEGNLIAGSDGNFYGTSYDGGSGTKCSLNSEGCGTVYEMTPNGAVTVLHAFLGGKDGAHPYGPVVQDDAGNLYGTTEYGGGGNGCGDGCGTVFKISPGGKETVLYAFKNPKDGYYPMWSPVLDDAGNLYGTTLFGGSQCYDGAGCGTVFRLSPDGTKTTLHIIHDASSEGFGPVGLVRDKRGNLFGTLLGGGPHQTYGGVFEIRAQN